MKKKFHITTTIPGTLNFFVGNLSFLNNYFEITAISSQKTQLEDLGKQEGVKTVLIPMRRSISLWYDIFSLFLFLKLFLKDRPDIVHGNTPKASLLSMLAAKMTGIRVRIYMCHGLRYQGTKGVLRWLLMQMEKITCACASSVICVSKGVRETLISDNLCSTTKAIVILHGSASGIDIVRYKKDPSQTIRIREELKISNSDFVFVFVGRIVQDKGINELINAFVKVQSLYSATHLLLIGSQERSLDPISEESNLTIETHKNIHAVGRKSDIRPYLSSADALVLPSYREGFGMVLVEAGAMGLPCITTDISGCNEIIVQDVNGEIIPSRDEDALYEKMKEWVENPEKVSQMAGKARALVESRYEQKIVWDALLSEYQRLLNGA